jgi:hypothetical protein
MLRITEGIGKNKEVFFTEYLLNSWSRVLEKLTGFELAKKLPAI